MLFWDLQYFFGWVFHWKSDSWTSFLFHFFTFEFCAALLLTHLEVCVRDWLFIHQAPFVRLVTLADFQHIAGDGALSFIQRSHPQQHQGAVSHLPELQVIGATWERAKNRNKAQGQGSWGDRVRPSRQRNCNWKNTATRTESSCVCISPQWPYQIQANRPPSLPQQNKWALGVASELLSSIYCTTATT